MIDVNAILPAGTDGADRVLAEARTTGRSLTLVRSIEAIRHVPSAGNPLALDAAAAHPGELAAIAAVAPLHADDPRSEVVALAHAGAVGFWVESVAWPVPFARSSVALDRLLAAIAHTGRPIFVPISEWGDASAIGSRTEHLGVPVVLVGTHWSTIADDLPAAERYPHLHLETSRLAGFRGVERIVARIGHERLVLGSGLPGRPPTSPSNAVVCAAIPDTAKRAILGGNAARLLGMSDSPAAIPEAITAPGAIDIHAHFGPAPWDVPDLGASELADALAVTGSATTVVSSLGAIMSDREAGNAAMVAACAAEPRLRGYLVVHPGDLAGARDHIRRWGDRPGIVGIKIHCQWSGVAAAAPAMPALFGLLADHGRPVKIHVDGEGWDEAMLSLARAHPRLPIIAAHAGPGAPDPRMARMAAQVDNLYLELASSAADLDAVREVVAVCGAERIVYGTDAPLLEPAFVLGTYADAGLRPDTHHGVFRDTASRIMVGKA